MLIETGSSDLWVSTDACNPFDSSTSEDTGSPFSIKYADGTTENGQLYLDTLSFKPSNAARVEDFEFALIQSSELRGNGSVLGIGDRYTKTTGQEYDNLS